MIAGECIAHGCHDRAGSEALPLCSYHLAHALRDAEFRLAVRHAIAGLNVMRTRGEELDRERARVSA